MSKIYLNIAEFQEVSGIFLLTETSQAAAGAGSSAFHHARNRRERPSFAM
jgi:hypothetical protein